MRGETMGTRYLLKCAVSPERVLEIQADVDALLEQFDAELSNWNPDSWVSQFNQSESVEWQDAPESVLRMLEASKTVHALSGGAFDVTISPLIELWGFGSENRAGLPDQTAIEEQLQSIGMDQLEQAAAHLVERIKAKDYHLSVGFLGVNILLPALTDIGLSDLAYRLIQNKNYPSWGYSRPAPKVSPV